MHRPPQPGPHDGAKLPRRPALLSFCPPPLLSSLFLHTVKPSHFTLHEATPFFFFFLLLLTHTTTFRVLPFSLRSMLDLGVHMTRWTLLLFSGQIQSLTSACFQILFFPDIFFFFFLHGQNRRAAGGWWYSTPHGSWLLGCTCNR